MIDKEIKYECTYRVGGYLGLPETQWGDVLTLDQIKERYSSITDDELNRFFRPIGERYILRQIIARQLRQPAEDLWQSVRNAEAGLRQSTGDDASNTLACRIAADHLKQALGNIEPFISAMSVSEMVDRGIAEYIKQKEERQ